MKDKPKFSWKVFIIALLIIIVPIVAFVHINTLLDNKLSWLSGIVVVAYIWFLYVVVLPKINKKHISK